MLQNSEVIGGLIGDTYDKTLSGNISPGTVITHLAEWGEIGGTITDQTDLVAELSKKENIDSVKITEFFTANPDYQNRYLASIDGEPIDDVKEYIQLIIDDRVGNNTLWIPFDADVLCLIMAATGTDLKRVIRFFIPKTGQTGTVDLTDESDLVKFVYRYADEIPPTEWVDIQGSIYENPELAAALEAKINKWDNITIADVDSLFD